MANTLNFNELTADFFQLTDEELEKIGETRETVAKLVDAIVATFQKDHEDALAALADEETFRAFIEELTPADLRAEDITEESIEDFFSSPYELKEKAIRNLDVLTVCSLYERKYKGRDSGNARQNAITAQIKKGLIDQFRAPTKPLSWARGRETNQAAEVLELKRNNRKIKNLVTLALKELEGTERSLQE